MLVEGSRFTGKGFSRVYEHRLILNCDIADLSSQVKYAIFVGTCVYFRVDHPARRIDCLELGLRWSVRYLQVIILMNWLKLNEG